MLNVNYQPPKAPKTETFTLTIKDVFCSLVENNKVIFNNKILDSLPDGEYHVQRITNIVSFSNYGLTKRIDLIWRYTKPSITDKQLYYLTMQGTNLIIEVYTKIKDI